MCYATAVYLRVLDGTTVETNLVVSKMRLVPTGKGKSKQLKKLTISRLELLVVLIHKLLITIFESLSDAYITMHGYYA